MIGPGAIGCLFAAVLAEGGMEVWLLDKDAERAAGIDRLGVRIDGPSGESRRVRVRATADCGGVRAADVLCVCVKAYDTASVGGLFPGLLGPASVVVSLQNGLGNVERLAGAVPAERIVCGATAHGATRLDAGHVLHAGSGPTNVAPWVPAGFAAAERVAEMFASAGIETDVVEDARSLLWSKLLINAAINPLTALFRLRNGMLPARTDLFKTGLAAAEEGRAVATAERVELLYADVEDAVRRACRRTRDNMSSMLQDVQRGGRTEIDAINGAIVREGERHALEAPVNAHLTAEIRALTRRA